MFYLKQLDCYLEVISSNSWEDLELSDGKFGFKQIIQTSWPPSRYIVYLKKIYIGNK